MLFIRLTTNQIQYVSCLIDLTLQHVAVYNPVIIYNFRSFQIRNSYIQHSNRILLLFFKITMLMPLKTLCHITPTQLWFFFFFVFQESIITQLKTLQTENKLMWFHNNGNIFHKRTFMSYACLFSCFHTHLWNFKTKYLYNNVLNRGRYSCSHNLIFFFISF